MIFDARNIAPQTTLDADVIIVGTGAAGVPLACEFLNSGLDVIVLEGGGGSADVRTQDLYKGEVVDPAHHGPLDFYRQRCFGGTTTTWGGRCAPFDAVDFEKRAHVPYSGWPIGKKEMEPYYIRAHSYHHLGAYSYEAGKSLQQSSQPMVPGLESAKVSQDTLWRFGLPTNMARSFGDSLRQAPGIRVYFHANCLKILTNETGTAVRTLEVSSLKQNPFHVRAKYYVLATGGLETTRLLLVSRNVHPRGIGNDHDLLGRFYGSHIGGELGAVQFTPKGGQLVWDYECDADGVYVRRNLGIREEVQRREALLNFRCILAPRPIDDPSHRNGILSAVYLAKRFLVHRIPPEYNKALAGAMTPYQRVLAHMRNVVFGAPQLLAFSGKLIRERLLPERKLPSVMLHNPANVYDLHFDAEQSPNRDSRVTLSDKSDEFGTPRLRVDWRFSETDVQSVAKSFEILRDEFRRSGVGQTRSTPEEITEGIRRGVGVGSHHIGTTRMASSPKDGVVDENCRVYGMENLFIASSSVFPTTSYANPTLTITAIAIRIADHVKSLFDKA
jgi:choline dehydrogenase-like flavoprotein